MLLHLIALVAAMLVATPDAELSGRISSKPAPSALTIQFDDSAVECPVSPDGRFACRVPRGIRDLRISAAGHAPRYLWNADLNSGCLDLGDLSLAAGASVSGWLTAERRGFDPRTATVKLVPDPHGIAGADDELRSYTVRANEKGFFQFANVFPATYAIVAEANGLSPVRRGGVVVEEEREYAAGAPLVLPELARMELFVSPPLAPDGKPWRVRVARFQSGSSGMMTPLEQVTADGDGIWRSKPLEAALHELEIADARGTTFYNARVEVVPAMPPLHVVISSIAVQGLVRLSGEPLHGTLTFTSDDGEQTVLESDETGRFDGVVAREGRWRAEIVPFGKRQTIGAGFVTIRRRDGMEYARVELDIAGGRVRGKVVDEAGNPVRAGILAMRDGSAKADALTGDDGLFELAGIEPGTLVVTANTRGGGSAPVTVTVDDDRDPEPITLVVAPEIHAAFLLSSGSGVPIAGAHILIDVGGMPAGETYSNPSGRFRILARKGMRAIALAITAPGRPSKIANVEIPEGGRVSRITIHDAGSVLKYRGASQAWVHHEGAAFPAWALVPRHYSNGPPPWLQPDGVHIAIEPGTYSVCPEARPSARCIQRTIMPGAVELFDFMTSDQTQAAK